MNDLTRVIRDAQHAGLVYQFGGKHPRLVQPSTGRFVTISGTPRCPFACKKVRRDLRKYLGVTL